MKIVESGQFNTYNFQRISTVQNKSVLQYI